MARYPFFFLLLLLLTWPLTAQDLVPLAPKVVLMDQESGRILYQKNPDSPNPPASLTKLMTLHLAWKALEEGRVKPDQVVPVSTATAGKAVPADSSLMFLEPGQIVTFKELMLGLAVDSGNDAGLTLATFLAGSEQGFVDQMNAECRRLGLQHTMFVDSFGYSAQNQTSALDYAQFCRFYLQSHPQAPALHAVKEWAYPQAGNWPADHKGPVRTIQQTNRNNLLWAYPGADGLKTGYISESGYNLAATAVRGNQRLVAVILGVQARSAAEGSRLRTEAATVLLDFGFNNFPLTPLPPPELPKVKSWMTEQETLTLTPQSTLRYPLGKDEVKDLTCKVETPREVIGPFPADRPVGRLTWMFHGKPVASVNLVSAEPPREANFFVRLIQSVMLFFQGLFGGTHPVDLSVTPALVSAPAAGH